MSMESRIVSRDNTTMNTEPNMRFPIPTAYLNQSPILLLFVIPLISAFYGIKKINLKSVIHFQQGRFAAVPWRIAIALTLLCLPPFCLWCLFIRGPSSLCYLLGNCVAVSAALYSVLPIVHYIPSPSISAYLQHRFHSEKLRAWLSVLQAAITFVSALFLLIHSASFVASVSSFSYYLVCSLFACFSVFAIIFSGHSTAMSPLLLLNVITSLIGGGIFLYFAIEDVTSFHSIFPTNYSVADCLLSFGVGFIVTSYLISASPSFYQAFFPVSTIHKLRLTFIFYAVFQLFACSFLYVVISLFHSFLEKHCNLQFSYSSFFQFTKYTVPHNVESYFVVTSFVCILLFCLQWQILSMSTHIWEEFVKLEMRTYTPRGQLIMLQFIVLVITILLAFFGNVIHFLQLPYYSVTPAALFIGITLCAVVAGIFLCGYFFPCTNYKGGFASLLVCVSLSLLLFYLFFYHNEMPELRNTCVKNVNNSTVTIRSFNMEKVVLIVAQIPISAHPIIAFVLSIVCCILVSALTGGQDQMQLDWNLVVFPCSSLLKGRLNYNKRTFIDSESFRYAQQNGEVPENREGFYG